MFKNVGKTIKGIAVATFILMCVSAFITGIAMMATDEDLIGYGFLTWIGGPVAAFIYSCFIYGFGEIVDTAIINRKSDEPAAPAKVPVVTQYKAQPVPKPAQVNHAPTPTKPQEPKEDYSAYLGSKWCSGCGSMLPSTMTECSCGCRYLGVINKLNVESVMAFQKAKEKEKS